MHFHNTFIVSLALPVIATTLATGSDLLEQRQSSTCPDVWTTIASDLKALFVGDDGQCTDDARQAIRMSFHDCFPGSCDGSLILADECSTRGENSQITTMCTTLGDMASTNNVSTADIIQFGTAMGIVSCPGGPAISFKVGRVDSSTAAATGQIPSGSSNATTLVAQFVAKGFTAAELVALVGAHTAGKQLDGGGMDSTTGTWDTDFYSETQANSAPESLTSDRFLSNSTETSDLWTATGASQDAFNAAFVPAMEKMSLLGNDESTLIDCSSVITDNVNSG